MFGIYRTFLALAVVVHHLISIPVIGHYAVHGFFILSGYLMTYIMKNSYGYTLKGVQSFLVNRFLRLYPSYWVVLLLSVLVILFWGEHRTTQFREFIFLPDTIYDVIQNLSLLYFDLIPATVSPRLSPPTWALTVEIVFYVLISLGISKSKWLAVAWATLSLIYMMATHLLGLDYSYRYSVFFAGSFPFSLGALIFYFHKSPIFNFIRDKNPVYVLGFFALFVLNSAFAVVASKAGLSEIIIDVSFYANYIINALIVIRLIDIKFPFVSKKADDVIGGYSYPIYLMHWQAGFVASMVIWGVPVRGLNVEGVISLILALAICFIFSYLIIRFVDAPIDRLRRRVKKNADRQLNGNVEANVSVLSG